EPPGMLGCLNRGGPATAPGRSREDPPQKGPVAWESCSGMHASLRIEVGQAMPPVCELSADRPVTLGRNKTNTVILLDGTASRWHAEVYFEDGKWLVRDFGTLNGTRVNGERIAQATPLDS